MQVRVSTPCSPDEAAAIAAAVERFVADTAPPPSEDGPRVSPWLRAALLDGVRRVEAFEAPHPAASSPWGS